MPSIGRFFTSAVPPKTPQPAVFMLHMHLNTWKNTKAAFPLCIPSTPLKEPLTKEAETYLSTQQELELSNAINWQILYLCCTSKNTTAGSVYASHAFKYLEKHKSSFSTMHSIDSVERAINQRSGNLPVDPTGIGIKQCHQLADTLPLLY